MAQGQIEMLGDGERTITTKDTKATKFGTEFLILRALRGEKEV
jgi:hypothetical protein